VFGSCPHQPYETTKSLPRRLSPTRRANQLFWPGLEDDLGQYCAAPDPGSLGRSRTVGLLAVGRPLDPAATEALRFNPWTSGEGIVPVGRLNWLRRLSYASSQ
jgi:hypothetical protein